MNLVSKPAVVEWLDTADSLPRVWDETYLLPGVDARLQLGRASPEPSRRCERLNLSRAITQRGRDTQCGPRAPAGRTAFAYRNSSTKFGERIRRTRPRGSMPVA